MDTIGPAERSAVMSKVRSRDTKPERRVRAAAHAMGLRFRLYRRDLPGRPDLVFPRYKTVIFVHGCFWHAHPGCARATMPKSRQEFWRKKLERNIERDQAATDALTSMGWHVAVIWECETKDASILAMRLNEIFRIPKKGS